MGVLNLWQILHPTARTTKIEGLEGKVLAIDISIWLYQATRGTKSTPNGHIIVLYNRICKLLYYKVKPIFVFDGPNVPNLKQRVLQERRNRHNAANKSKALENKIKQYVNPSQSSSSLQSDNSKRRFDGGEDNIDDMFILPESSTEVTNEEPKSTQSEKLSEIECVGTDVSEESRSNSSESSSGDYVDFEDIDKNVFESLPDDIKYEIMTEHRAKLKERKKQSFCEFPQNSEEFSNYQVKLLSKKGAILNQISDLKKSIRSSYSAGTQYDDVYYEKVASNADHEVVLLKKRNSFISFGKSSESSNSSEQETKEDKEAKKKEDEEENPVECLDLTDKTDKILKTEEQQFESTESHLKDEKEANQTTIQTTTPEKQPEPIEIHEKSSQVQVDSPVKPENIIEKVDSPRKEESQKSIIIESSNEPENKPDDEKIEQFTAEKSPIESDNEEEDEFVEVENDQPPNDEEFMLEEVQKTLKEKGTPMDASQMSNQIRKINEALESDVEIIDDSDYSGNAELENNEFFNQIASLVKQKATSNEYTNFSSSRIESHIIEDAKHLLRLFGLPYIDSPGEAEAQCAYLDYSNMCDGSITEDSDTWLFGGKRIYKNFFGSEPCIDVYTIDIIKNLLGLDRFELINLALLVGSDYTLGIENVGLVKGVEILNEFEGDGIEKLKNFKEWYQKQKEKQDPRLSKLRQALVKLKIPESFPSEIVFNAYINPDVDKSNREFIWTLPELDLLRKYLSNKIGWTIKKIDDDLLPIIKRVQDKMVQKNIDSFFLYDKIPTFSKQSKRMKSAIENLKTFKSSSSDTTNTNKDKAKDDIVISSDEDLSEDEYKPRSSKSRSRNDDDSASNSVKKQRTTYSKNRSAKK